MPKAVTKAKTAFPSQEQVFAMVFDRIAEKGLGKTRMSDLARKVKVPVAEFYAVYPSIEAILDQFLDSVDSRMVESIDADAAYDKRDLYFDMLMSRFDRLQEYRAGVQSWLQELAKHPLTWGKILMRWEKSLSLMLDIAQDSPVFPVKKLGLAGIYAYSLREWLKDETTDLAKTMAAVDKALGKADEFTQKFLTKRSHTAV